eukprot:g72817.t1
MRIGIPRQNQQDCLEEVRVCLQSRHPGSSGKCSWCGERGHYRNSCPECSPDSKSRACGWFGLVVRFRGRPLEICTEIITRGPFSSKDLWRVNLHILARTKVPYISKQKRKAERTVASFVSAFWYGNSDMTFYKFETCLLRFAMKFLMCSLLSMGKLGFSACLCRQPCLATTSQASPCAFFPVLKFILSLTSFSAWRPCQFRISVSASSDINVNVVGDFSI